jgi:hypothetical protein
MPHTENEFNKALALNFVDICVTINGNWEFIYSLLFRSLSVITGSVPCSYTVLTIFEEDFN